MKRVILGCTALTALGMVALATPAFAVDGHLPGGTAISATIDSPANNAVLPPGPVTVSGQATIGQGLPVANTALTYVLDASASTFTDGVGCGGDQNGDGTPNTVMDCEIAAAKAVNAKAVTLGTVGEVGAVAFGSDVNNVLGNGAFAADVQPAAGEQLITGPATDNDGSGGRDIEQVLSRTFSTAADGRLEVFTPHSFTGGTNFEDAVIKMTDVVAAATKPNKLVIFLSDGKATSGNDITDNLADPRLNGSTIFTFAVGSDSSCTDTGTGNQGSLKEIAETHNGICRQVSTADLPDVLPGLIASQLTSLSLTVDALPPTPITDITPGLPHDGPANVSYSVVTPPLAAGTHTLCVTANGTDGGGAGDVTDCHTVIINAAPTVNPGGPYAGQEGTPVAIAGSVTDPEDPVTSTWSIAFGPDVDPGTTCQFGDAGSQSTTVTCTDDGTYTLTLTGSDGVNPPVSASTTMTLTNVAPAVSISAPANGTLFAKGTPVAFTAPFTDIGTNDSHTCAVNFDDGSPVVAGTVSEVPGSGSCATTHAFTALGVHNVLVRITDDDGDAATAVVRVVIFLPGEAFGIQASGLVNLAKTPLAKCPPDESKTVAAVNLAIASVNALTANCTVDTGTGRTVATATIASANLLGGLIRISTIESSCVADANGIVRSSRVGTINGTPIGTGSGSLGIPGVAQVFFNETATGPGGQLIQNAVRVRTLLGQEIILSGCRLG